MANLKITLVKSTIGAVPKNKKTVEALGLKKIGASVERPDNKAVRGMIQQVRHLVKVEEHKGQKARSGAPRPGFEGGQMPLYRRLPKRGFKCINSKTIVGINVSALEVFDNDAVVSVETLLEKGIVKNPRDGVKILGNGELTKKLTVQANAFSASAKEKIEALGGKAEVI